MENHPSHSTQQANIDVKKQSYIFIQYFHWKGKQKQ